MIATLFSATSCSLLASEVEKLHARLVEGGVACEIDDQGEIPGPKGSSASEWIECRVDDPVHRITTYSDPTFLRALVQEMSAGLPEFGPNPYVSLWIQGSDWLVKMGSNDPAVTLRAREALGDGEAMVLLPTREASPLSETELGPNQTACIDLVAPAAQGILHARQEDEAAVIVSDEIKNDEVAFAAYLEGFESFAEVKKDSPRSAATNAALSTIVDVCLSLGEHS